MKYLIADRYRNDTTLLGHHFTKIQFSVTSYTQLLALFMNASWTDKKGC